MAKDLLIAWLNDAYAMENALVPILQNHADDARHDPDTRFRIQEHVDATKRQAERVRECVERLGSTTSTTKSALAQILGSAQSVSTGPFSDELVKNALMDYATEHFEIACYEALGAAASRLGETDVARVCKEIAAEERQMADWLREKLPGVVQEVVQKQATRT